MSVDEKDYPLVALDLMPKCCDKARQSWERITRKFVRPNPEAAGYDIAAIIDLRRWTTFDDYFADVRHIHKGSAARHAKKARRCGYSAHIFPWKLHVPDACEINFSKPVRCGKPMRPGYTKSVKEMGGAPQEPIEFTPDPCPYHHMIPWGVFKPIEGYRQGKAKTGEKLLAYIKFKRIGDMVLYTQILGHGDYLKDGVMYFLHLEIIKWLYGLRHNPARFGPWTDGIRYIVYAQFFSGNQGLRQWKKKLCFEPARLVQR